jgi:hypothetical protein
LAWRCKGRRCDRPRPLAARGSDAERAFPLAQLPQCGFEVERLDEGGVDACRVPAAGAVVQACDQVALERARTVFGNDPGLRYFESSTETLVGADVLMVVTEWPPFERLPTDCLRAICAPSDRQGGVRGAQPVRSAALAAVGVQHFGIGRCAVLSVARPRLERLAEAA